MIVCKSCNKNIADGNILECKNCGTIMCSSCAEKTKKICPYCYNDLEFFG